MLQSFMPGCNACSKRLNDSNTDVNPQREHNRAFKVTELRARKEKACLAIKGQAIEMKKKRRKA